MFDAPASASRLLCSVARAGRHLRVVTIMELFVGNLPLAITVLELRQVLGPGAADARYQLVQRCDAQGSVHCFARVQVPSDAEAQRVIAELQVAGSLGGRKLAVRRYRERNAFRDRRARWRTQPWHGEERRREDRRTGS